MRNQMHRYLRAMIFALYYLRRCLEMKSLNCDSICLSDLAGRGRGRGTSRLM